MLIFLINLDQRPDRMAFMRKQLDQQGLEYRRITAVDGLGDGDIGYPADHPRLTKGEFACYLSHVKTWEAFIASDAERCLILEDDVALSGNFAELLHHDGFYKHNGCITRFECRTFRVRVARLWRRSYKGSRLRRLTAYDGGSGALVLTRDYVTYLLAHHRTPLIPVDDLMLAPRNTAFRPHIVYQLDPAPATQRLFLDPDDVRYDCQSDLQTDRLYVPKRRQKRVTTSGIRDTLARRIRKFRNNILHTRKIIRYIDQ